jgi:flagellar L-ring protein precursor FlgH
MNRKSEVKRQIVEVKRQKTSNLILLASCFSLLTILASCAGLKDAREIKNAPMPPKYYATVEHEPVSPDGSLWKDAASLYEDRKARRVNDLLTILIAENVSATNTASTNDSRDSSGNYAVADLFGANTDFGIQGLPLLKKLYPATKFTPTASGSSKSSFAGKGDTSRKGTITATITAKVVEVMPNSNMVVESRKEVIVNNEKQIVVLRGIVRPDDISTTNTIISTYVADAQIYLVGDGVLADKQSQGWLVRALDIVWPF